MEDGLEDKRKAWLARREPWRAQPEDARDEFATDHGRVVHSGSFRRLQGKTQILNLGESDFYRTRLTHSLEVAQIADNLARQLEKDHGAHACAALLPGPSLIQAIALTHDLGHPPFGHGGEVALNYCMRKHGGFEGNGQTLRILAKLEKFSEAAGANLTRRAMLGTLKYPVAFSRAANPDIAPALRADTSTLQLIDRDASKPPKCHLDCEQDAVDWILEPLSASDRTEFVRVRTMLGKHAKALHKSFDCTIMDVADDIAYGVHDLEDALALRLVGRDDLLRYVPPEACAHYIERLGRKYGEADPYERMLGMLVGDGSERKRAIGRIVHHLVTHCEIETLDAFEEPLLRHRVRLKADARSFLDAMQALVRDAVIKSPSVQQLEFKGQRMVVAVYEALLSEPRLFLPTDTRRTLEASVDGPERVVCDHVSGMADGFLLKTYDRLFSPRMGSVFDKL